MSYVGGKVAKGIGIISKVRIYVNKSTFNWTALLIKVPLSNLLQRYVGTLSLSCKSYINALVKFQKEL